jgi:hypothetical protein
MRIVARHLARFGHSSFRGGFRRLMPARRMAAANLELRWHSLCQMGRGNSSLPDLIRRSIPFSQKDDHQNRVYPISAF